MSYCYSVAATTIRLEADLVRKVAALKPRNESVYGFVRGLIEKEYLARNNRDAAVTYRRFLVDHPEEQAAMEGWETAPLVDEMDAKRPGLTTR